MLAIGGRSADLDWLLDLAGGLSWPTLQALRLYPKRPYSLACSPSQLEILWRRHLGTAEPLQYLVGRCPWRDLELTVGPGVLIPRQETELLIDLALTLAPSPPAQLPLIWADLGTGSGCLAISLARALPQSHGLAADVSPDALAMARSNVAAAGLKQRIELRTSLWWKGLESWWGKLALVVANPPYIPTATVDTLEPVVRLHEPRLALDGGPDGLAAIRQLVGGAHQGLAPGGVIVMEHHHDQSDAVCGLLRGAGLEAVASHLDLEGTRRFASARRRPFTNG